MVTSLSGTVRRESVLTRILGSIGMVGSPLFGIASLFWQGTGDAQVKTAAWVGLFFLLSWMSNLTGMRLLRVTGNGKAARILFIVQMVGLSLACGQQLQDALLHDPRTASGVFYTICDMAWPLSMLLMLVTFGFIVKANVWTDWRKWPALVHGLSLPLFFAAMAVLGREQSGFVFLIPLISAFFLEGLAVATTRQSE